MRLAAWALDAATPRGYDGCRRGTLLSSRAFTSIKENRMYRALRKKALQGAFVLVGLHSALNGQAARAQWQAWQPIGNQKFDAAVGVVVLMPKAGQVKLLAVGKD